MDGPGPRAHRSCGLCCGQQCRDHAFSFERRDVAFFHHRIRDRDLAFGEPPENLGPGSHDRISSLLRAERDHDVRHFSLLHDGVDLLHFLYYRHDLRGGERLRLGDEAGSDLHRKLLRDGALGTYYREHRKLLFQSAGLLLDSILRGRGDLHRADGV